MINKKLKIDFMSDLHLDFYIKALKKTKTMEKEIDVFIEKIKLGKSDADVLIIPGDLGHHLEQDKMLLLKCKRLYKYVIIVRGNHDLYLYSEEIRIKYLNNSLNIVNEMKEFCSKNEILYLDGDLINIEGKNIYGIGMFWDDSIYKKYENNVKKEDILLNYSESMPDGKKIFIEHNLDLESMNIDKNKLNFNPYNLMKIEKEKLNSVKNEQIDVIVSHYGPISPPNVPKNFQIKESSYYYFDGKSFIDINKPKIWLFGHTHLYCDFNYKNTRLLCNPHGYPGESTSLNVVQTIEV